MKETKKKKYCADCGGSQINHTASYISILLTTIVEPFTNIVGRIIPEYTFDFIGPTVIKILVFLRLGYLTDEPNDKDIGRTRVLWEEAKKRGIKMQEFHLFGIGQDIFICQWKKDRRFFDALPRPKKYNPRGLEWMDNKGKMKKHFQKAGIKVARGKVTGSLRKAKKLFESLNKPVITKPNLGSRSRHTTTHINDMKEFIQAYKKARQLSPWVMTEEELEGYVFRGTLINKKLVAVIRREPAYVIGDGIHNVKELIEIENKNPKRQGPIFHQLHLDEEARKELAHFGKDENTIPNKDEIVTLGQKTSRAVGGGITDVTNVVHEDNKQMLEKIAEVLDDPIIGVDFIMSDASVSYRDQPKCGVIECNSAPFIDLHHYPLVGEAQNVAGAVWDMIYPDSKMH